MSRTVFSVLPTLVLAIVISACSVHNPGRTQIPEMDTAGLNQTRPAPEPGQLADQLPALPVDRYVDTVFGSEINGQDTLDRSANAIDDGTALQLISGTNEVAWGIWQFSDLAELEKVQAVVDVPAGEAIYLAIADHSAGRWEFDGPLNAGRTITLDEARFRSPQGNFHIAALTFGGDTARIMKLVLTTHSDWQISTVDDMGGITQTALDSMLGKPMIVYNSTWEAHLAFVHSDDPAGTVWSAKSYPSVNFIWKGYLDLEIVDARPAIVYTHYDQFGSGNSYLYFNRAADAIGNNWGISLELDVGQLGEEFWDPALAVINGNPAVSYVREGTGYIATPHYSRALDKIGSSWSAPLEIDDPAEDCSRTALAVVDGTPIVSYEIAAFGQIRSVGSADATGAAWNPSQIIAAGLGTGPEPTACGALVNFGMSVSYYNTTANSLQFARYSIPAMDWEHFTVDEADADSSFVLTSLAVIAGNPAICYFDEASASLKYVRATDAKGSAWGSPETVDRYGPLGLSVSLTDIYNRAAISYVTNDGVLRYAYRTAP